MYMYMYMYNITALYITLETAKAQTTHPSAQVVPSEKMMVHLGRGREREMGMGGWVGWGVRERNEMVYYYTNMAINNANCQRLLSIWTKSR